MSSSVTGLNLLARSFTYTENNVGDKTHPCLTPILTLNHSVKLSFNLTVQDTDLYKDCIALRKSPCLYQQYRMLSCATKHTNVSFLDNFLLLNIECSK